MKYYSKSPQELHKELKEKERPVKRIRLGTIILLVDLVIIVLVGIFVFQKKSKDLRFIEDNQKIIRASSDEKKFFWQNYQINSKIFTEKNIISVKIVERKKQYDEKNKIDSINESNKIQFIQWFISDSNIRDDMFSGPLENISKNKESVFYLPDEWNRENIYLRFLDPQRNILFQYRIYP